MAWLFRASVKLMQRLMGWLLGKRAQVPSAFPVMFRVRDASGTLVPRVRLSGVWQPTGRRVEKSKPTADGVCIVTWPKTADRLVLTMSAGDGRARVEVDGRRAEPSRVIEVELQ